MWTALSRALKYNMAPNMNSPKYWCLWCLSFIHYVASEWHAYLVYYQQSDIQHLIRNKLTRSPRDYFYTIQNDLTMDKSLKWYMLWFRFSRPPIRNTKLSLRLVKTSVTLLCKTSVTLLCKTSVTLLFGCVTLLLKYTRFASPCFLVLRHPAPYDFLKPHFLLW